jgi:hypothetical protein
LINNRHYYATQSTTVAERIISNVIALSRKLNVVQFEGDPLISSPRAARASRKVQFEAQQREAARVRAFRRRPKKLMILST